MNGLIIKSVEGRITLGIVMFVAIMILIGWVAINEPARMASFTEQQNGRAIERGAELYTANCSSCHGVNGQGSGLAPALNSPHFFGYDFMADVNSDIVRFQREEADLQNVITELTRQREEALTAFNALAADAQAAETGRLLLVQVGTIDARLLDDAATVTSRLAGIESGTLASEDATPVLTESELTERQTALTTNIPNRLREINLALNGDGTADNAGLLAAREAIMANFGAARLKGYLPRLDELNAGLADGSISPLEYTNRLTVDANRLAQIGWGGTLDGYILTTLIHGRPGSNSVWNNAGMVSWSQRGGGPLRDDQLRDIIAYILNWNQGENWDYTDLNYVQQFAKLHVVYTGLASGAEAEGDIRDAEAPVCSANAECVAGTGTIREIAASLPAGDATNGSALYTTNACAACHVGGVQGPDVVGTLARVESERLTLAEFAGWTPDEYLVTSILYPNHFYVPNYPQGLMPVTFGQSLTVQNLADIIAYIKAQ